MEGMIVVAEIMIAKTAFTTRLVNITPPVHYLIQKLNGKEGLSKIHCLAAKALLATTIHHCESKAIN
jgi:hypothetical protein